MTGSWLTVSPILQQTCVCRRRHGQGEGTGHAAGGRTKSRPWTCAGIEVSLQVLTG